MNEAFMGIENLPQLEDYLSHMWHEESGHLGICRGTLLVRKMKEMSMSSAQQTTKRHEGSPVRIGANKTLVQINQGNV